MIGVYLEWINGSRLITKRSNLSKNLFGVNDSGLVCKHCTHFNANVEIDLFILQAESIINIFCISLAHWFEYRCCCCFSIEQIQTTDTNDVHLIDGLKFKPRFISLQFELQSKWVPFNLILEVAAVSFILAVYLFVRFGWGFLLVCFSFVVLALSLSLSLCIVCMDGCLVYTVYTCTHITYRHTHTGDINLF